MIKLEIKENVEIEGFEKPEFKEIQEQNTASLRNAKSEKEKVEWFKRIIENNATFRYSMPDNELAEYSFKPLKVIDYQFNAKGKDGKVSKEVVSIPNLIIGEIQKYKNGNTSKGFYRLMPSHKGKNGVYLKAPKVIKNALTAEEYAQVEKNINGQGWISIMP